VDIESVSEELYRLPLDEFIPTRTDHEKQARSAGDKDLAAQIHRLAKPNVVAWLANQLAREHTDEIRFLLQLGPALREATASGSGQQLRELSRQQSKVVYAVVEQARKLASAAGQKVSQDTARALEDTLRAALADPDAADALAAGRLTEGMQNSGFGSGTSGFGSATSLGGRPAGTGRLPAAKAPDAAPATAAAAQVPAAAEATSESLKAADHEVAQAKSSLEEASAGRQERQEQLEVAAQTLAETADRIEQARKELDDALQAQSRAQEDQLAAQAAFDRDEQVEREAQRRLSEAKERRAALAP
jgi:hypothetical protein